MELVETLLQMQATETAVETTLVATRSSRRVLLLEQQQEAMRLFPAARVVVVQARVAQAELPTSMVATVVRVRSHRVSEALQRSKRAAAATVSQAVLAEQLKLLEERAELGLLLVEMAAPLLLQAALRVRLLELRAETSPSPVAEAPEQGQVARAELSLLLLASPTATTPSTATAGLLRLRSVPQRDRPVEQLLTSTVELVE